MAVMANLAVDPYGVYGAPEVPGLNARKPAAQQHAWVAKAARAERVLPRTLLLGNSRVDIGFDPESSAWADAPRPVFNMGVPGSGIDSQPGALTELEGHIPLAVLYIGLEFLDFLPRRGTQTGEISNAWPAPPMRLTPRLITQTAASLGALGDSLYTVLVQDDPRTADMTPLGYNPFREYLGHVAREGHAALAAQKNASNIESMARLSPDRWSARSLAALRTQLEHAARHGIRVVLFTFPYHAEMLETMALAELWTAFTLWKGLLVETVSRARKTWPSLDVALWDFAGYSPYTTEPFPPRGDTRTNMRWYWEPGHFKAELGTVMLRRMRGEEIEYGEVLGQELSSASLASRLAGIEAGRLAWRSANPEAVRRLESLVARTRRD
ncbi:MAG: hypothetical protein H6983_03430 [Ectothiorhodospiraceae bacterium]|nr:hypothetical protein [Ectothiorhodospiraceae bacterium]